MKNKNRKFSRFQLGIEKQLKIKTVKGKGYCNIITYDEEDSVVGDWIIKSSKLDISEQCPDIPVLEEDEALDIFKEQHCDGCEIEEVNLEICRECHDFKCYLNESGVELYHRHDNEGKYHCHPSAYLNEKGFIQHITYIYEHDFEYLDAVRVESRFL